MRNMDLGIANVEYLIQSFNSLRAVPEFDVMNDFDVRINLFLKRKDKFCGIRTALQTAFESPEEFLICSFMIEDIPFHEKNNSCLDMLNAKSCSNIELHSIYRMSEKFDRYLPRESDVKNSLIIVNNSELNWVFLVDETKYHSVFWSEADAKLFSRCA